MDGVLERRAGGAGAAPLTALPVEAAWGLPPAPWRGRAALLFRRTAYFCDGGDAMVALVGGGLDPSPAGLRLGCAAPGVQLGLTPGSRLEREGDRWLLDGRPLALDPARAGAAPACPSLPRLAPEGPLAPRLEAVLPRATLDPEWLRLGRAALALGQASLLAPPTTALATALLGCGSGSTPAGDDLLVGLLAGLARQGRTVLPLHRALAGGLAATCRLSRHFLHHALAGRFHLALVRLAGLPGLPGPDHPAARALAAQGDRSGRAALAGYLAGLHLGA
jgi:hypothetical protein